MEYRVSKLTRSVINRICDAVLPIPSLDPIASEVHTSVMRERIRDQLADIEMIQTEEAIEMLIGYMVNRQRLATIKDDTNVGLPASEASSASIAQVSMSAFKSTSQDVSLAVTVNKLSSSLSTVADRSDQKVIVHFNPDYAPEGRFNYSLREVADIRAIFVKTTLQDLIFQDKIVIGVLSDYEGDGLSPAARIAKESFREDSFCAYLAPGNWNRIRALKPGGIGIVCMRLYLDSQLAYSRGISMISIIKEISKITGELDCSVTGSSLQDGVVDILSRDMGTSLLYVVSMMENMKSSFKKSQLGGIDGVSSMALERVDLLEEKKIISSVTRASEYHVAQLGTQAWMNHYNIAGITWSHLENETYLVSSEDLASLQEDSYAILGILPDQRTCIYLPEYGGMHASPDQLTDLYINYYLDHIGADRFKNLWVIRLDVIAMRINCIDMRLVKHLLTYCGLTVLSEEQSRTSELLEYLYISSVENPKDIIARHFNPKSYYDPENQVYYSTNPLLSSTAKRRVGRLVTGMSGTSILKNIESQFLDRMSKYYYAVLSVDDKKKKPSGKEAGPIVIHVASTVYIKVLEYPFVSREKTTCNDWFTMNYVLGADGAKNNYIREPLELFQGCDIKMDPRHLGLIGDYVYERGVPSGMGLVSMQRHGIGFTHEMSTQNTYSQLYTGHLRNPEPVESYSVSTYMGTPPVGAGTKEREVERAKRIEDMERSRLALRRRQAKIVSASVSAGNAPKNSDAIDIAVRSMFLDTDPYYGIPTFKMDDIRAPPSPDLLVPLGKYSNNMAKRVRDKIALDSIVGRLELLREYTGHIMTPLVFTPESGILDMDALFSFFTEYTSFFSE